MGRCDFFHDVHDAKLTAEVVRDNGNESTTTEDIGRYLRISDDISGYRTISQDIGRYLRISDDIDDASDLYFKNL
jgi:hypothetical protein